MQVPYTAPAFRSKAFNCPLCGAYAEFDWREISIPIPSGRANIGHMTAKCSHCQKWTLWALVGKRVDAGKVVPDAQLVYPALLTSPMPSPDLPEECQADFSDARSVAPISSRAAAALLRLCIQRLCKALGEKGDNINEDVAALVRKGLDRRIQQALDIVRVTGNNAVHPGTMDLADDATMVVQLFGLINMVVDEMITKPKHLQALYAQLPETARAAIEKRDGKGVP